MQLARPAIAAHPRQFGRGPMRGVEAVQAAGTRIGDDLKLFATTFAAGFVFVAVLLG